MGVAFSHLRYDLGREFSSLDADGTADIASLYACYPLIRSRDANLYALGSVDAHWFTDRIRLLDVESRKRSQTAMLGLTGDSHDLFGGGGWTTFSLGWTFGNLDIRTPLDRAIDDLTARSNGHYNEIRFAAARLQTLSGPLSLYASIRGQLAFDNLDSSEKMELGGAYGVRAYPEGEAYGDEGYDRHRRGAADAGRWTGALPGRLQLIAFVDAGEVDYAHNPWFPGPNRARRSGYGAGLNWPAPTTSSSRPPTPASSATRRDLGARPSRPLLVPDRQVLLMPRARRPDRPPIKKDTTMIAHTHDRSSPAPAASCSLRPPSFAGARSAVARPKRRACRPAAASPPARRRSPSTAPT